MKLEKVQQKANFSTLKWRWNRKTNCYAYAVGLDIPDFLISRTIPPYYLGYLFTIYKKEFKTWQEHMDFLSNFFYDKRIQLDLKTIAIPFEQIDLTDKLRNEFERKIVFFKTVHQKYYLYYGNHSCQSPIPWHSFHFYVQDYDGIWKHKNGYEDAPTSKSRQNKMILNPIDDIHTYSDDYEYQSTYRLTLKR